MLYLCGRFRITGSRVSCLVEGASLVAYDLRHFIGLLLVTLAVLCTGAGPALAAPPRQDLGVTLHARPAYEGIYRAGSWLPIIVDLENEGVDRTVEVRVGTREGVQYAAQVELPNNGRKSLTVYAFLPTSTLRLIVRVMSEGQELLSETVKLRPVNARTRIIGLLGDAGPAVRLPARLPDGVELSGVTLNIADLPEHPLGLSSFDALVLDDMATADLDDRRKEALLRWVLRGGQLILGGGTGAARTLEGLPAELRPVAIDGAGVDLLLDSIAGPAVPTASYSPSPDADTRLPYPVPLAGISSDQAPVIEQTVGNGSVTFVSFGLSNPTLDAWGNLPGLWSNLLRVPTRLPSGFAPEEMSYDTFVEGSLASTLTNLPALSFPPLLTLGALLIAYILVVGPGIYLLLRRLDRQALGWVVVPLVTVIFAALAYSIGFAQRGGDVVFNQVTLVEDLSPRSPSARIRSFVGVFSPTKQSYSLSADKPVSALSTPLVRPISVQGPWDTTSITTGGVFIQEPSGAAAQGFEVGQWSMRAVSSDMIGASSGIESSVRIEGDRLIADVRNSSDWVLKDVAVVQGERVWRVGDLEPGVQRTGELQKRPTAGSGMPLSYLIYADEIDANGKMGGQPLPVELQLRTRILDSLYSYGPLPRNNQPLVIAWSDMMGLELNPEGQRAERQNVTIIVSTPRLTTSSDSISLGQGWLAPRFENTQNNLCYGNLGSGVALGSEPAVMQLNLPRDLYGLRPAELKLLTGTDGPWLPETTVELYDWGNDSWIVQNAQGRPLSVTEPERYLSSHGKIRVRLGSTMNQPNFNCVYVDVQLKGMMP